MPSAHTDTAVRQDQTALAPQRTKSDADLDTVELELAIDLRNLQEFGFEYCLQQACAATKFEFLFQLPVFDHIPGQRIAVLSTGDGSKLLFAVLNNAGNDVDIVPSDDVRPEIRSFASAFMDVFTQLGRTESRDH